MAVPARRKAWELLLQFHRTVVRAPRHAASLRGTESLPSRELRIVIVCLGVLLSGCAALDGVGGPDGRNACALPGTSPLLHWRTIRDGTLERGLGIRNADPFATGATPSMPGLDPLRHPTSSVRARRSTRSAGARRVRLLAPAAVAARANDVYVADVATQTIYLFDGAFRTATPFARLAPNARQVSLYLDEAHSLYVVDTANRSIVQFDRGGNVVREIGNESVLPQPVAMVAPEGRGELLVADGIKAQVFGFSLLGQREPQHRRPCRESGAVRVDHGYGARPQRVVRGRSHRPGSPRCEPRWYER